MDERRKHKRIPINLQLEVNQVFKQDNEVIGNLDAEIEVVNISKTGIGFKSTDDLPLNYYFNAKIEFDHKEFIRCVLKIVRKFEKEDVFDYGCEFVGLAEYLLSKIEAYEARFSGEEE